uniref:Rx N-terminal domain-containing protein n=1 Tax=Oryza punctata TaxID=4537 RepID=A0A0E0LXJ8_ORYPU
MAESLLLPVVRGVAGKAADALVQSVTRACGVDGDRRKLERQLLAIQCMLADAEAKSESNPAINRWMKDLRAVAYKADDILDDFQYEALRPDAAMNHGPMAMASKVLSYFNLPVPLLFRLRLSWDLNNVLHDISKLVLEMKAFGLVERTEAVAHQVPHRVSDTYTANALVRSFIELATKGRCDLPDTIELLRGRLQEVIGCKRFLLVLDDVWSEEEHNWEDNLKPLLLSLGGDGSVILVTTRSQRVASIMGTLQPIDLPHLSEEHSWELFSKKAFSRVVQKRPESISIGKRIVQKCRGLPLALKTMGGLMSSKQLVSEWEAIAESNIGDSVQGKNNILAILKLSYTNLSSETKRCFAFCAVFPKNYMMEKGTLIQLWIANGFLHEDGTADLEQKGELIFSQLVWRSFLQVVNPKPFDNQTSRHGLVGCQMHDLMHDLAKDVTDECSTIEDLVQKITSAKDVRHLKISCDILEQTSGLFKAANSLRTLLSSSLSHKDLNKSRLMSLRALCCTSPHIINSHRINTKHIRYLDFSHSEIVRLPSSICMLYNLQSLRLNHCRRLQYLPEGMRTLRNLNHLYLFECDKLKRMPPNISLLNKLHTLTAFVVDTGHGYGIAELRDLRHLRNRLELYNLIKIESGINAREASLYQKKNLSELSLCWGRRKYEWPQYDIGSYEEVLEAVEPHSELKVLEVHGYGGTKFPKWMINSQMCECLRKLIIFNCPRCKDMPIAELLVSLEYLSLGWMDNLTTLCKNVDGAKVEGSSLQLFPKLKVMFLENLPNLERWVESSGREHDSLVMFPQLEELSMYDCPEVASAPNSPLLKKFSIMECRSLPISSLAHLTMLTELDYDGKSYFPSTMPLGSWHSLVELRVSSLAKTMVPLEDQQMQTPMESLRSLRLSGPDCFLTTSTMPLVWECFAFVKELYISECNELVHWPMEELRNMTCLRFLSISCCSNLQGKISPSSEAILPLPRLEMLSIHNCTTLLNIPRLPASLEELEISNCEGLMTLPSNLGDEAELKRLYISGCVGLKMLPDGFEGLISLQQLTINGCPGVQKFPHGLVQKLPSLKSLKVEGCPELQRCCITRKVGTGKCFHLVHAITHKHIPSSETRCNKKNKTVLQRLLLPSC